MSARGYELDEAVRRLSETVRRLDLKTARVRTATGTTSDPGTTGIPGSPPNVEAALAAMQAEIEALPDTLDFLTSDYGEQAKLVTVPASGAAYTIDVSVANSWDIALSTACTLSLSNPAPRGLDSHIQVNLRGNAAVTLPAALTLYDPRTGLAVSAPDWTTLDPDAQVPMEWASVDGGVSWGCELPSVFVTAATSFGTPALTLSTTNGAGAASTAIRTDATIALFDATVPANVAGVGAASSTGSAGKAARRDHGHALTYHDEPLTDGASNFIFDGGDIIVVTGVPN